MKAPELNRQLVLEAPQRVPDGAGGFATTWEALGTLWAGITPRTGGEASGEVSPVSKMSYKIVLRGAPHGSSMRPKPEQRFREGMRIFTITAVTESDPLGRYLTCFAQEELAV